MIFSHTKRLVLTLRRTHKEKGKVTATRHQDRPKRIQPKSPMLVLAFSLSSEIV